MAKGKTQPRGGSEGADLLAKFCRRALVVDEGDVIHLLRAAVEREGGQSGFARRHGIERSRINRALSGKRPVGRAIARALGLRRVYAAE
jgi:DNA-binding phage protein